MKERVQKLMARADFGSRRASEQMIRDGRVTINGVRAALGDQADPSTDDIRVDGIRIKGSQAESRYFVLNKPRNVLSVTKPQPGDDRRIVRDMIPVEGHLFVIGRLDAESEGLMVLTNDGELAHKLAHPSFEHTKTYKVTVYGHPTDGDLQKWEEGVWLDGKKTARCYVRVLEKTPQMTTLRIVMIEGRKRQIRQVANLLGYNVSRLIRTHIGQLGLGTLSRASWYELGQEEVAAMLMPAEELKFIRRRHRTFRPRTEGEAAAAPSTEETPARHRVPVEGDRSKPARVARSLILKDLHRRGGNSVENPAEVPTSHRQRPSRAYLVEGDDTVQTERRPQRTPRPATSQPRGSRPVPDKARGSRPAPDKARGSNRPPRYANAPEENSETPTGGKPAPRPSKPKTTPAKGPGGRPGGSRPPVQKGRSNKPPLQRKHGQ